MTIAPTPRLYFRPLEASDVDGMFVLDSDPAVHRYLGGIGGYILTEPNQSADIIAMIQEQYRTAGIGRWAVLRRGTDDFVGWAGLKLVRTVINGRQNFYDLGYRLRPEYWRQGLGYEAAQAWLDYGFGIMQLPEICAYADVANLASCRILEKIGLRRGNEFDEGGTRCAWFEANRADWLAR
jgi:ribosomal-protein-alanine N-acetyltransferase